MLWTAGQLKKAKAGYFYQEMSYGDYRGLKLFSFATLHQFSSELRLRPLLKSLQLQHH